MSIKDKTEAARSFLAPFEEGINRFLPDPRLIPGLAWIVVVLGGSLTTVFLYSFMNDPLAGDFGITFEHYRRFLGSSLYQSIMVDSILIAIKTTIGALLIGYPLAYYIAMQSNRRNLLLLVVIAPIWINEVIRYFAWILILDRNGVVNWLLVDAIGVISDPLRLIYTENAVVISLVHPLLPYMVIPIVASLIQIDYSEIEAAKNLGATRLQAFWEVSLPQTKSGIVAGSTFVFVLSSGAYLAPVLLGGNQNQMIANFIGVMFAEGQNWNFGAVLAMVYSFLIILLFVFVGKFMDVELSGTSSVEDDS
ncbi:ABC transporter permease [Natronosalvus halobius]|uniref:ABC transporter permease n=1 Tax=Natronosalvus halobius TaxID=2953746 RepID=UPI00209E710B|nr:ABC transporter permease [Natronosalvus halobius]USZ73692.1 ABC transporter permease [Natronosalvus halobius]